MNKEVVPPSFGGDPRAVVDYFSADSRAGIRIHAGVRLASAGRKPLLSALERITRPPRPLVYQ